MNSSANKLYNKTSFSCLQFITVPKSAELNPLNMFGVIDRLNSQRVRKSTAQNYLKVWRIFNKFLIRLDWRPQSWEDKTALFCAYLIDKGNQSTTVRSYVSAIKAILKDDGYHWNQEKILISSFTQACKLKNDVLKCRLPISRNLLEIILFENKRWLADQQYLQLLHEALFCLLYYGMMRIGELTQGDHPVKAKDIHIADNKDKILLVLHMSKTHSRASYPQKIKINAMENYKEFDTQGFAHNQYYRNRNQFFCPFTAVRNFITVQGQYNTINFFTFRDGITVKPEHTWITLRKYLNAVNLNGDLYDTHSFRIGRTIDMFKMGKLLAEIRQKGRWWSNIVFKYLRDCSMD